MSIKEFNNYILIQDRFRIDADTILKLIKILLLILARKRYLKRNNTFIMCLIMLSTFSRREFYLVIPCFSLLKLYLI